MGRRRTGLGQGLEQPQHGLVAINHRCPEGLEVNAGLRYRAGRAKLRIVQQYNGVNVVPYFPQSPTYKRTVRLAK